MMITFRNKPLTIVENNPFCIKFSYNNKIYEIRKCHITDNPYSKTWDMFEDMKDDVMVFDGYARSVNNTFKCTFPTLEETFSNFENLIDALCYRIEHEDLDWYDDILDKLTLWDIFEGYYFSGRLEILKCGTDFASNKEETKTNDTMKEIKLSAFVKATTLEQKIEIINAWEEDRGADGEYVYDLDNDEDAKSWLNLYGAMELYACRAEGRYWMGGHQFTKDGGNWSCKYWCVTEAEANKCLEDNQILWNINERYMGYLTDNAKYQCPEETIAWVNQIYHNLIDFTGYAKARGDIKEYDHFAWIAMSNDGCYQEHDCPFQTREEAYNSMRDEVLHKMKWNTEFDDVCDGQGEEGTDTIGYDVHFAPTRIWHKSYSGTYLYLIVRCDSEGNIEPKAWENLECEFCKPEYK